MAFALPSLPILARRLLRLTVLGALNRARIANSYPWTINSPGSFPTAPESVDDAGVDILVRCGVETKVAIGDAMMTVPNFATDVVIEVEARLNDPDPVVAQDRVEDLAFLLEELVIKDKPLHDVVQQIVAVQTRTEIDSENSRQNLAGVFISFTFRVPEIFDPSVALPEPGAWPPTPTAIESLKTVNLQADVVNACDPHATYP